MFHDALLDSSKKKRKKLGNDCSWFPAICLCDSCLFFVYCVIYRPIKMFVRFWSTRSKVAKTKTKNAKSYTNISEKGECVLVMILGYLIYRQCLDKVGRKKKGKSTHFVYQSFIIFLICLFSFLRSHDDRSKSKESRATTGRPISTFLCCDSRASA